jgi:hypothetical protein
MGVLEEDYSFEWDSPSFAIPMINRAVRVIVVNKLRNLHLLLKSHPFLIPNSRGMIRSMERFILASALELNMGFYDIKLDADAQKLYTIVSQWYTGK